MSRCARFGAGIGVLLMLAACAASSSAKKAAPVVPAGAVGSAVDASYDWHVLVLAPFGMLFKESPIPLHEVLLFHDAAPESADAEGKDCYTVDRPPRFVGKQPDPYLLCFDHDRLRRIEASVRLTSEEAPRVFSEACALWLKAATPTAGDANSCEGRDGATAFSAHFIIVPGNTMATLSLTLSNVSGDETHAP